MITYEPNISRNYTSTIRHISITSPEQTCTVEHTIVPLYTVIGIL